METRMIMGALALYLNNTTAEGSAFSGTVAEFVEIVQEQDLLLGGEMGALLTPYFMEPFAFFKDATLDESFITIWLGTEITVDSYEKI